MTECDNNKVHISINFVLSICLIIMLDNLLLKPSLHCNTSLHFTTLHPTTLHLSTLPFLSFTLHYPLIWLNPLTFPIVLFHLTSLNYTQYSSHLQTYFIYYDTIPVKIAYANVSFYTNNSKMPYFVL